MLGANMLGAKAHMDAASVRRFWKQQRDNDLTDADETIDAYINESRWVADCPNCNGGIAAWPENEKGCCLDCGYVFSVAFPSSKDIREAEDALLARPERNRNWLPASESVSDLKTENTRKGYLPKVKT